MRKSTYEIILPLVEGEKKIENKALLVNGLYFSFDVVAKEAADKFAAGDFAALPLALRERLLLRGHLTRRSEAEEIADMKLLGRVHRLIPARAGLCVVIMPTYNCNFRCPYCFEQHRLKKGQEWLSSTMSHEMVEAVFAAIGSYKARGYALGGCTLYGGEPFLAENIGILREIAGHAKKLSLPLDAITNGYDLKAYLDFMEEYDCKQLQVTVDGVGEVNDRRRIHKDGLPTYDRILSNVELALQRGISISLRVNVGRENISGMGALIDDLRRRGFPDRKKEGGSFSYYFKATNNDRHPENNITEQDIIGELMKNGFTAMEAIGLQSQYSAPKQALRQIFAKDALPQPTPAFCGSEAGMLVIDPFGKLYPCWDIVAKEGTAVGFTDEQTGRFLMSLTKAKWRTRTSDLLPACETCPYVFICRGGCASRAFVEHGSYFWEHCGEAKEIFAFVASRVAGETWAQNHESELSISLSGPLSRLTEAERRILTESRSQKEIFDCLKAAGLWEESRKENS